jgi:hypothetical protein
VTFRIGKALAPRGDCFAKWLRQAFNAAFFGRRKTAPMSTDSRTWTRILKHGGSRITVNAATVREVLSAQGFDAAQAEAAMRAPEFVSVRGNTYVRLDVQAAADYCGEASSESIPPTPRTYQQCKSCKRYHDPFADC